MTERVTTRRQECRQSFDLFEQTDIAEKALTGTEKAEQGLRRRAKVDEPLQREMNSNRPKAQSHV